MYKIMIKYNSSIKKEGKEQKNYSNQKRRRNRQKAKYKTKIMAYRNYPKEIKAIWSKMSQKQ